MYKLDTNNHSVFSLNYHLIFVTKHRRKVINDKISNRLLEIFKYIGNKYHITVVEWNNDEDHVHILFKSKPNVNLSVFINAYKAASSRLVKKEFPSIRSKLWHGAFWSKSYCLISVGGAPLDVLKKYIESQGEHA